MALDLNGLQVKFSADASPVVESLNLVGTKAIDAKYNLDELTKSTTAYSASMKELSKVYKNFKTPADLFGFKDSLKQIQGIDAQINSFKKNLDKAGDGFAKKLKRVEESFTVIDSLFKEPKDLFKVNSRSESFLTRLNAVLDRLDADYAKRNQAIANERQLLSEKRAYLSLQRSIKEPSFAQARKNVENITKNVKELNSALGRTEVSSSYTKLNKLFKAQNSFNLKISGKEGIISNAAYDRQVAALDRNTLAQNKANNYLERFAHVGFGALMAATGGTMMRGAYERIADVQKMRARVDAWGLTRGQRAIFEQQTKDLKKNNPLINMADAYSMMMSASSSIGHYDPNIVGQTVNRVTKYAQMERALGYNASDISDIAKNYYGVAEARQVVNDLGKTLDTFRTVFRITTTTAGKITVGDIETILRNMGQGAATISDDGLLRLLAYAEQIKVAGRGSAGSAGAGISTVGTNVKMLQLMGMGKPSSIHAKKMIGELGLLEDSAYVQASDGSYRLNFNGKENSDESQIFQALQNGYLQNDKDMKELKELIVSDKVHRGDYGQAVGNFAQAKLGTYASTGFYNKELAQTDPVKFVESTVDLVSAYAAKKENRKAYFGSFAEGKEGMSDADFLNLLNQSQLTSAMTTFWAKTGLSQRVVSALTTFANPNFIMRSEHMMETAKHQKSADEIMLDQIQSGNLMLAVQRVSKAFDNLVQTMEPIAGTIGRIIYEFADFIDRIAQWIEDYRTLANLTAGWLIFKTLISSVQGLVSAYGLLERAQRRAAGATAQNAVATAKSAAPLVSAAVPQKAQSKSGASLSNAKGVANWVSPQQMQARRQEISAAASITRGSASRAGFSPFAMMSNGFQMFASSVNKAKGLISGLLSFAIRAASGIGWAFLAIDLASVIWEWVKDWKTAFGTLEEIVQKAADKIKGIDFVKEVSFSYSDKQQALITDNDSKLTQVGNQLAKLKSEREDAIVGMGGDGFRTEDGVFLNGKDLSNHIEKLTQKIETLTRVYGDLENNGKRLRDEPIKQAEAVSANIDGVETWLKNNGVVAAVNKLKAADALVNQATAVYDASSGRVSSEKQEELHQDMLKKEKERADAAGNLFNALQNPELVTQFAKLNDEINGIENIKQREKAIEQIKEILNSLAGFNLFTDPKWTTHDAAVVGGEDKRIDVTGLTELTSYAAAQVAPNEHVQKILEKANRKAELPTKAQFKYFDKLNSARSKALRRIAEASRPQTYDANGTPYQSYADIYEQNRLKLMEDLVSGSYRRKHGGATPFLKNGIADGENATFTPEDFDIGLRDAATGMTGHDLLKLQTQAQMAEDFNKEIVSAISSVIKSIKKTAEDIDDARADLDDRSVAYTKSADLRRFDRETDEKIKELSRGKGTDGWTAQQQKRLNDYVALRTKQRGQTTTQAVLSRTQTYKDENREFETKAMSPAAALTFNYNRNTEILRLEHERSVREAQEQAKREAQQAKSEKARTAIYEKANKDILMMNEEFNKNLILRQNDYNKELQEANKTALDRKIEDWKDLDSQIDNLQNEMMEGFVEANEKWLDGDLDSWRDYANSLLKTLRRMFLQQGYADLLGGITGTISGAIKDFTAGAFGLTQTGKDANGNPRNTANQQSAAYGVGNAFSGWIVNGARSLFGSNQAPSVAPTQSVMGGIGNTTASIASSLPWARMLSGGTAQAATAGVGSLTNNALGITSSLNWGGALSGGSSSGLSSMLGDVTSSLGSFDKGLGALTLSTDNLGTGFGNLIGNGNLLSTGFTTLTQNTGESGGILDLFTGWIAKAVSAVGSFISSLVSAEASNTASSLFANGGIMTSSGPLPLKMYANGGIAKSAQVAVFGEGSRPEAYVPLPDGRSIPVTINNQGNGAEASNVGGNNVVISINVTNNQGNSTESESSSSAADDTSNMRKLANNIKSMVKQEIANQSRPGGLLYNGR